MWRPQLRSLQGLMEGRQAGKEWSWDGVDCFQERFQSEKVTNKLEVPNVFSVVRVSKFLEVPSH